MYQVSLGDKLEDLEGRAEDIPHQAGSMCNGEFDTC